MARAYLVQTIQQVWKPAAQETRRRTWGSTSVAESCSSESSAGEESDEEEVSDEESDEEEASESDASMQEENDGAQRLEELSDDDGDDEDMPPAAQRVPSILANMQAARRNGFREMNATQ